MKNVLLLLLVVLILPGQLFSQSKVVWKTLQKGAIVFGNNEKVRAELISIRKDSVSYYEEGYRANKKIVSMESIYEILEYKGTGGTSGSIFGSLIGGAIGVVASLATQKTERESFGYGYMEKTTIQVWPIYVGVGVGGLIGHTAGKKNEKWKSVYKKVPVKK